MDLMQFLLLAFSGSLLAGVLGAMLGLGGGIIVIPLLTLFLGIDIRYAIGASIVSVIATSSAGASAYLRDGLTNLRLGLFLGLATVLGAASGALVAPFVAGQALYIIFAAVLGCSALAMLRRRGDDGLAGVANHPWSRRLRLVGFYKDSFDGNLRWYNVANLPLGVALMYLAGIVSGLLGIGGGALTVPTLDLAMRVPLKVASATSNFMLGMTAAASAGIYLTRGEVVPLVAGPVALGVLLGAVVGAQMMMRVSGSFIRRVFVAILVVLGTQMAAKGLGLHLY